MLRCYFCKTEVDGVEAAIEAGWIPYFYIDDREIAEPVCPVCASARLELDKDGEYELAAHNNYADAADSAERGNAWLQAAALWQMAADKCRDAVRRAYYENESARCRARHGKSNGKGT